jgi:hypothetical protein
MYRIIFEAPPSPRGVGAPGELSKFLQNLDENHRGEWVRLSKARKHISYLFNIRKAKFPNMEIVTRKNPNGTFGVWVRFHNEPVKTVPRGRNAKKKA